MLQGTAKVVKAPAEQEKATWAGALVPAVELDDSEGGDMIVVVVKLIDDRQAADLCLADCSAQPVQSLLQKSHIILASVCLPQPSCISRPKQWQETEARKPYPKQHAFHTMATGSTEQMTFHRVLLAA